MLIFRSVVLVIVLLLAACGGCKGENDEPAAGEFKVLAEGEGPSNAQPLFYLTDGTTTVLGRLFGIDGDSAPALIRGPYEIDGREVHRLVLGSSKNYALLGELFFTEDDNGVWLLGGARDGMLSTGVLRVPHTVKVGQRWQSGASTFEVTERTVEPMAFGAETVRWQIAETPEGADAPQLYRNYIEGWGQFSVSNNIYPGDWTSGWGVSLEPPPAKLSVPEFDLQPAAIPELELEKFGSLLDEEVRLDIIRAVRGRDNDRTALDMVGFIVSHADEGFGGSARPMSYSAGQMAHADNGGWPYELMSWSALSYAGRYVRGGVHGNSIFTDAGLYRSTADFFLFENVAGGVDGVNMYPTHGCPFARLSCTETVVEPGSVTNGSIWGGSRVSGRVLLGEKPVDATNHPFGQLGSDIGRGTESLWTANMLELGYGMFTQPARFAGAMPDAVSTLTTLEGDFHYAVSPFGFIEKFSIGEEGVKREYLGRARVPEGQTLRAAVEVEDGKLVLVTHQHETERHFIWTAEPPQPVASPTPRSIYVKQVGFDAHVCWSATDEQLDKEGWSLGGVPALEVVDLGDGCALVVRDLAARPIPNAEDRRPGVVPGWGVLEGPVPGAGLKRALFDVRFDYVARFLPQIQAAWLKGGGVVHEWQTSSNDPAATTFVGPGGISSGRPALTPYSRQIRGFAGYGGEGSWFGGVQATTLAADGSTQSHNGFALVSNKPQLFPFDDGLEGAISEPIRALQQGGVLVGAQILKESDHLGMAKLRPDGTFEEIEHPTDGTPFVERSNGELCGLRVVGTDRFLYCAMPDGQLRETRLADVDGQPVGLTDLVAAASVTPLFEDRFAVMMLNNSTIVQVDFEQLQILSYEMPAGYGGRENQGPFRTEKAHVGADGLLYASLWLNNVDHIFGAFTVDRFKPIDEFIDMSAFFEDPAEWEATEISRVTVDEQFAYVFAYPEVYRIPRSVWDGNSACEPTTAEGLDADGDGFVAESSCGNDCDDSDAAVNSDAAEVCDGIDNDCDGRIDEGGNTCWTDADGDGFAPADAVAIMACECEPGWTNQEPAGGNIDCSDNSADAFPGQTEFFELGIPGGTPGGFHDYDCDGVETERWPRGSCAHNGVDACDYQEGFIRVGGCGTFGDFLGCPEVGTCSDGGCVDSGALICVTGQTLRWKQTCR